MGVQQIVYRIQIGVSMVNAEIEVRFTRADKIKM